MTWHIALDVGLVVAGLLWLAWRVLEHLQQPRPPATPPARPQLRVISTHELGLAHRFASRVVGSSERPRDEDFTAIAVLWPYLPTTWRVLPYSAAIGPAVMTYARPAGVFLAVEEAIEKLEELRARLRRGRRHGKS